MTLRSTSGSGSGRRGVLIAGAILALGVASGGVAAANSGGEDATATLVPHAGTVGKGAPGTLKAIPNGSVKVVKGLKRGTATATRTDSGTAETVKAVEAVEVPGVTLPTDVRIGVATAVPGVIPQGDGGTTAARR